MAVLHLAVSAVAGIVLGALAAYGLGPSAALPGYVLTGAVAVALGIADARVRRLPHVLSGLVRAGVAAVAVPLIFLTVALTLPGQLGLGDVATIGWISLGLAWRGWTCLQVGLAAGLLLQAVIAVGAVAVGGRGRAGCMPMGPALAAGWLVGLVWPAGG